MPVAAGPVVSIGSRKLINVLESKFMDYIYVSIPFGIIAFRLLILGWPSAYNTIQFKGLSPRLVARRGRRS